MSLTLKLKNLTNGRKYITAIIEKYKENEKVNDIEILELLQYHPTKHITIKNIDYLIMRVRSPYNNLALFYKYKDNERVDDISYVNCIKNLFGKYVRDKEYEKDVMTAFRNESHIGSKKQYFISNTKVENDLFYGICDHCKIETNNITTDHFPIPYKQIFQNFIKEEQLILSGIEIFENNFNEIRIQNGEFAKKWLVYHDEIATYRLLCKPCNSHFGSYENNK